MVFDEISLSVLAILGSVLILSGFVTQIIKGYQTKRLEDVSKYLMSFLAIGAFLWMIYGFEKEDFFIVGVNVAAICLTMTVLVMKFRYKKHNLNQK